MKSEFALAFNEILEDKQLPKEIIIEAIEMAMVSAYKRAVNAPNAQRVEAKINLETGKTTVLVEKEVTEDIQDERTEVTLEEVRKTHPDAQLGDIIMVESTPKNFGRVAAQTARQVIQQRLREAEREAQLAYFENQVGEIVSGIVQAISHGNVTIGLDKKAEGLLPRKEQIPGDRFHVHDRVRALLLEIKRDNRGPRIILSRTHRKFLMRLLENEVPEIYHGQVEIRSIAREPGHRSKVAVYALKPGIDPVGACVGIKGVRIQTIVRELQDEKIDVIEWDPDPKIYIAKALSPARVLGVYVNPLESHNKIRNATVVVPEDQLSLAIGRDGQNARLAAKLTGWRIDIQSLSEAVSNLLFRLQNDKEYLPYAEEEAEAIEQAEAILAKKSENRPLTPEEYRSLQELLQRVETAVNQQREEDAKTKERLERAAKSGIPAEAFETPIEEIEVSLRISALLREAGYDTVGSVLEQLQANPDKIANLPRFGIQALQSLKEAIAAAGLAPANLETETTAKVAPTEETAAEEPVAAEAPVEETPVEEVPATETVEPETEAQTPVEESPTTQTPDAEKDIDYLENKDELLLAEDENEKKQPGRKKKKSKKKKKHVRVKYDPIEDEVIYIKKHRRNDTEWDDDLSDW